MWSVPRASGAQTPRIGTRVGALVRAPLLALLSLMVLAGCLAPDADAPDVPRADVQTDAAGTRPVTASFSGTSTGTPAMPDEQTFPFEVPRGAVGVNGTLSWSKPPASPPFGLGDGFELELIDPAGDVVATGYPDVEGRLIVVTIEPPRPGEWTFVVRGIATAGTDFALEAVAELIVPQDNTVVKSLELGQRSFYEVNLILEQNASFHFSFNASGTVNWDVHSHPPEGVKEWETGSGTTAEYSFTAPAREVYSILWENPGALPVDLAFEVHGAFRIHSHSG